MTKHYAKLLLVLAGVLGLGVQAHAQREAVVTIPFEFVAAGKTMPEGTYIVSRTVNNGALALVLSGDEGRAGIFVLPAEVGRSSADVAKVSFEEVAGKRFLSKITTLDGVYSIRVPHPASAVAETKSQEGASASGAN